MAQVYDHLNQNSSFPQDNILNLVNERLLKPTDQQQTSKLKNYFLGYKECLDTPPSPALSDQDQLFSYLEQGEESSTNFDKVPALPPSCRVLLQNPPEVESQVNFGRNNKSRSHSQNEPERRKGSRGTERKGKRGCTRSDAFKASRVVKEYCQSTHHMETRSRTGASMGLLVIENDRGYHDQHGGSINLTQRGHTITSTTQKETYFNKDSFRSTPLGVTRARRTNARRHHPRRASEVQLEGLRKTRNSKGRVLHVLMPPQSGWDLSGQSCLTSPNSMESMNESTCEGHISFGSPTLSA
ncbi:uncharacterized protein BP5553_08469 [Venustampulla echinocandica]|uniref:Uncharacterized protein n=1 Tax=Venustampulla echinocandica TaxID=2656787 RepID=A0A370TEF7_9HELO|nr:uncharacterized protein BP5553_08469 [Venustampulla echinocandica]RDL33030.1 hypothetical protein BP5553_08469 [Venustampulla echinocandica]